MTKVKFQATVSGRKFGYVYVLSYPGSDKLKIGHSLDPFDRAEDIGGTKAPDNPVVEAFFWCAERREDVERAAHKLEQGTRHNGEWFDISVAQAMATIRKASEQVNVEIQLVYDRDDCERRAAKELETERQALAQADIEAQRQIEVVAAERIALEKSAAALVRKCMNCNLPLRDFVRKDGTWVKCKHCGHVQILRQE